MLTAVLLLLPGLAMADTDPLFWPLRYDERGLPLTDVIIDGKMHTLMLDTGSSTGGHFYERGLNELVSVSGPGATRLEDRRFIDISGIEPRVPVWKLNHLIISGIRFNNIEIVPFKPWGLSIGNKRPVNEVMGLGLFHDRRFMVDFRKNRLWPTYIPSLSDIDKSYRWSSYPVEKTQSGLLITAIVGGIKLKLLLDTATSHSMLFADRLPSDTLFSGCKTVEPEASYQDCRVTTFSLKDNQGTSRNESALSSAGTGRMDWILMVSWA
ncbi:Uncharacterised protein [Salmonella enterica subsp. arizonae]|nr:Uncharacterised protein [Salmonella enterica subsp. arizonae]